jgi:DNA-binding NarL/FixJ family response regulator
MIRVLLADDQALVRDGFAMILDAQSDIEVVACAGDGHEAVRGAREHEPDVVLMDVRMPTLDGLEATRRVLAERPATRVLILTTFDMDEYVFDALKAGASGFLLKDVPRAQLVHAVRTVAGGAELLDPAVTRRLIERAVRRPGVTRSASALAELSEREAQVLTLLARGLSNAEIAGRLVLGEATIKTHVAAVLRKLGLRDRVQAVVFAYESGIVEPGDPGPT